MIDAGKCMRGKLLWIAAMSIALCGCASAPPSLTNESLRQQVIATELAFARTMAARDHDAFTAFVSDQAVFLSGDKALRGRQQISAAWKAYYTEAEAPFSWRPEQVEVDDSGRLAISTGPVFNSKGEKFATFTSIWRQESPGVWHIIFDKGDDACH
jgi:ketosteroid isomerase-like protein